MLRVNQDTKLVFDENTLLADLEQLVRDTEANLEQMRAKINDLRQLVEQKKGEERSQ